MDEKVAKKIESFFTQYRQQIYKKGEILVRAEENPTGVFYLKEGNVKVYVISKKGEEFVINIFKPNSFFPMSWVINHMPNNYFFEAMTEIHVYKAPPDEVSIFVKSNPDVLYDLISRVYQGIEGVLTRMVYLMSGSAYGRLITELLIYAKRFSKGQNSFTLDISEKDLAAQSGMTRETVSREMRILKEKGLLSHNKSMLTILNVHLLEKELAEGV